MYDDAIMYDLTFDAPRNNIPVTMYEELSSFQAAASWSIILPMHSSNKKIITTCSNSNNYPWASILIVKFMYFDVYVDTYQSLQKTIREEHDNTIEICRITTKETNVRIARSLNMTVSL